MDIRSFLRDIVLSQLKKNLDVSFSNCSKGEKRKLIAMELQGADGWDMLYNTDGPDVLQIIYSVYVKKNLSAEKALDLLMDGLIRRYHINIDEKLEEEFREYINEFDFSCDASEYSLDCISRARDVNKQINAGW